MPVHTGLLVNLSLKDVKAEIAFFLLDSNLNSAKDMEENAFIKPLFDKNKKQSKVSHVVTFL